MADTYDAGDFGGGEEMYGHDDELMDGGVREDVSCIFSLPFF